ncbi:MAG TPA: sugar ABC transporter permease [Candidatus Limiplasma sp.]|nr:sugar ABC transporter permease [Candidatus Limiplasma sp.]
MPDIRKKVRPRKPMRGAVKEALAGYAFASPAILGVLILTLYPMLASLYYSFNLVHSRGGMEWLGLENYKYLLTNPASEFPKAVGVTLFYTAVNVVLVILFCLLVALMLNRRFIGRNFLRGVFFLPSVMPTLSVAILWKMLLQNQAKGGLINWWLITSGLSTIDFLNTEYIFVTLFSMSLWTCGGTIVVLLATLQDVPLDQLEAVSIDGGNAWHKFARVTYPTIKPVLFFQLIMCVMTSVQVYTQSVAFSRNGAPNRMTYFINVMIYDHAFIQADMRGIASAEAWLVFLIILIITGVLFRFQGSLQREDRKARGRGRWR